MKNFDSISQHPTAVQPETCEPCSRSRPSRFRALSICGLALVIGGAFLVRQVRHVNGARSALSNAVAHAAVGVSMRNVQFDPMTLEIMKGTVVEWKNDDLIPHTATSPLFDSGAMASGRAWRHTFSETGNFPYACTFHPNMKGVVIVK